MEPEPNEGYPDPGEQTSSIESGSIPLSSQSSHQHDADTDEPCVADEPREEDEPREATEGPVMTKKYATATMMEPQQENTHLEQMQERPLGEQTEIPLREPQATMTKPETKAARHSPPPVMWNPFWVQNWKYGPPAVFIAITSVWGQIDFWCRILLPWQEMKSNYSPAGKSLLIAYVSCNPVVATRKAWKNGHWVVVSTSVGLGLLHLLIIFSTALLALEPTAIADDSLPIIHTTRFARGLNISSFPLPPIAASTRFVAVYAGIWNKGLQHPNGTFANLAYESVEPVHPLPKYATVIANTVAFFPELNCEVAIVDPLLTTETMVDSSRKILNLTFTNSICSFTYSGWKNRLCNPEAESCPDQDVLAWWKAFVPGHDALQCNDGPDNTRIIFAVAKARYQQEFPREAISDGRSDQQGSTTITNMTGIVCRPRYTLKKSLIRFKGSLAEPGAIQNVTEVRNENESSWMIHGFSNFNLTQAAYNSLAYSPVILQDTDTTLSCDSQNWDKGTLYRLMRAVNGNSDLKAFLDPQSLIRSAEAVFQGLSSQIAREYLLTRNNDSSLRQIQYIEDRIEPNQS